MVHRLQGRGFFCASACRAPPERISPMTPSERFWTLLHELADVLHENARNHQVTADFAADLHMLPQSLQQNCQRDLNVVAVALTHLSEHLLPSQSRNTRQDGAHSKGAGEESATASAHQMEESLSTLDNEGSPIPGTTPAH